MSIKVRIDPFLQEFTDSQEMVEVAGETVGECLDNLEIQFPDIKKELGSSEGPEFRLYPDIVISVNSKSLDPDGLAKPVKDGDELTIGVITFGG